MPIIDFPPVELANNTGLIAVGGDLSVQSLLLAYSRGIYPWPIDKDYPIAWFSPNPRGVIEVSNYKLSSSLKKFLRKCEYKISFNENFEEIITKCQEIHKVEQDGTWITDDIIEGYTNLHKAGFAYSIEVKDNENNIIGGLYGVNIGQFVSGESMFHTKDNASKVALAILLFNLKENEIKFFDTQMITPTTQKFGAKNITRRRFIQYLKTLPPSLNLDFNSFEINPLSIKW